MRIVPLLISATGLAGAVAVLAVTAYNLRSADTPDPASEIRESAPAPPVVAPQAAQPIPAPLPAEVATIPPPQPPSPPTRAAETDPAPVAALPRAVGPGVVAVPPVDAGVLERVDPRPPLSPIAAAPRPKKPAPKPLLFQPVADAAGVIVAGGRTIAIDGIESISDAETCVRDGGGQWPCGRAARTAFRAFMRGRAVTCDFPEGDVPDRLSTTCRIGQRDIGAWLVENGWARAAGSAYAQQAKAATEAKRGVFGPGPTALPAELAGPTAAVAPIVPEASGPADISILPSGLPAGPPASLAAPVPEDVAPPGSVAGEPPPVNPLPPPSSPLR